MYAHAGNLEYTLSVNSDSTSAILSNFSNEYVFDQHETHTHKCHLGILGKLKTMAMCKLADIAGVGMT